MPKIKQKINSDTHRIQHGNDVIITPLQIHRMIKGIGCANCGRPATMKICDFDCCGVKKCIYTLKLIGASRKGSSIREVRKYLDREMEMITEEQNEHS